ncbi:MAG: signal peptide peptidase SppA [Fulvivirga sp.]|mgnify:CR=1 FL=1
MNFLKNVLSTLVALILFTVAAVFIGIVIIGALSAEEPVVIKENSILHLKLTKPVTEMEKENPFEELFPVSPETIGLIQVKEAIAEAAEDNNIKGIYLEAPYIIAGIATVEELRQSLIEFKNSGKFIVAYGEMYSEGSYYLASAADKIYLHPEGDLEWNGLAANLTFFRGMLDKLRIEPQIFRVGEYKSAIEAYERKDMSPENREQIEVLLTDINDAMVKNIAESRQIAIDRAAEISEKMLVRSPKDAADLKVIDGLLYEDQVFDELKDLVGIEESEDLEFIKYNRYRKSYSNYSSSKNEVAVIVASGEILPGQGDLNTIGGAKFSKEIRKARLNAKVKAIVLRINSPGGSFLASDVLWREITLAAREKPVIASLSDVAASGGYYMAMGCDSIVAHPNTITGSIGIYSVIFNAGGFLNDKLGITTDEVSTGEVSALYTMDRPLNEQQKRIIQNDTDQGYETFVTKAAAGRGTTVKAIKAVASGRVWSGSQAIKNGLVDIIGGLDIAVEVAAEKAEVSDDYKVKYYPRQKPFLEQLISDLEGDTQVKIMKDQLGDLYPYVLEFKKVGRIKGLQTRLPFDLQIQ